MIEATPPDDAGAEAQARFKYQVDLATCSCLQMLAGESIDEVICEWHEDYVVTWSGRPRELTSVKHLEGDQPRWTMRGLISDGGVKHLYDRWVNTGRRCKVRLQTNSGLRLDSGNGPGALAAACSARDAEALDAWAEALLPDLEPAYEADEESSRERVRAFLDVLTLEGDLPSKEHARTVFIDKYATAACDAMDLPREMARRLFDCVAELVWVASRSNEKSVLAALLRSADDRTDEVLDLIAAKLIDPHRVRDHVRECLIPTKFVRPLRDIDGSPAPALVQKLQKGGFPPTTVNRARHLRVAWQQQRRTLREALGVPNHLDQVEADLFRLAEQAELDLDGYEEPYGRELHRRLAPLIAGMSSGANSVLLDEDLLWGGIYTLTHNCRVWWSSEFEIEVDS